MLAETAENGQSLECKNLSGFTVLNLKFHKTFHFGLVSSDYNTNFSEQISKISKFIKSDKILRQKFKLNWSKYIIHIIKKKAGYN